MRWLYENGYKQAVWWDDLTSYDSSLARDGFESFLRGSGLPYAVRNHPEFGLIYAIPPE
jgi:hypothetical protein